MRFLFLFLIFVSAQIHAADYASTCANFPAPLPGGYCIHKPTHHPSRDILYHLHGKGGSQADWADRFYYPEQIRQEWKTRRYYLPTVISVSFGPIWLLSEQNASPYSGLFEKFTRQVMPQLEAALGGLRGRRLVMGESMGGFNTLQLALKTHLFDKAAALCAPVSEVSPFAAPEVLQAYAEKSAAFEYYKTSQPNLVFDSVREAATLAKGFFPTEADYSRGNPLTLARTSRTGTPLYLAAGYYDKYALYEGTEKLVGVLQSRRWPVEWHAQWGGHCAMDIPSLARFLVQ